MAQKQSDKDHKPEWQEVLFAHFPNTRWSLTDRTEWVWERSIKEAFAKRSLAIGELVQTIKWASLSKDTEKTVSVADLISWVRHRRAEQAQDQDNKRIAKQTYRRLTPEEMAAVSNVTSVWKRNMEASEKQVPDGMRLVQDGETILETDTIRNRFGGLSVIGKRAKDSNGNLRRAVIYANTRIYRTLPVRGAAENPAMDNATPHAHAVEMYERAVMEGRGIVPTKE